MLALEHAKLFGMSNISEKLKRLQVHDLHIVVDSSRAELSYFLEVYGTDKDGNIQVAHRAQITTQDVVAIMAMKQAQYLSSLPSQLNR